MSKEFFEVFPTFLGAFDSIELHSQELTSFGAAQETGDKRTEYVRKYIGIAEKVGKEFKMNPITILAQAAIESGWGTSKLATENHNFFGFTAYGATNEFWKGAKRVSTSSGLPFRSYDTVEDGFRDFARLISLKYNAAYKASNDVAQYATLISSSPYINEKNGDNRTKYKQLIIANALAIVEIAKKFLSLYN
jgi:flagellar protein FlgJ